MDAIIRKKRAKQRLIEDVKTLTLQPITDSLQNK
jgi:hypothetical protein